MLVAPYLTCSSALALAATRKNMLRGLEVDMSDEEIGPGALQAICNAGATVVGVSMSCQTGALDGVCEHLGKLRKLKCTGPVDLAAVARLRAPLTEVDLGEAVSCSNLEKGDSFDVAPLASCSTLRVLDLADTKVTDVSSLSQCSSLTTVRLTNTKVVDLGPLARGCGAALEVLDVRNTCVADTSPLSACVGLRSVDFQGSEVGDVSPLSECLNIEDLNLRNTRVINISPLGALKKLKKLHLGRALIANLKALSTCTSLQEISLERTWVVNLEPLSYLPIVSIDIRNTAVAKLDCLRTITTLKHLYASNCKIQRLNGLSNCTNLEVLDLVGSQVDNVAPLSKCTSLETIHLQKTPVKSVAPLADLPKLSTLSLSNCKQLTEIRDLCEGPAGKSLTALHLDDSNVTSAAPISHCTNIEILTLSRCPLSDISPLRNCQQLHTLYLQVHSEIFKILRDVIFLFRKRFERFIFFLNLIYYNKKCVIVLKNVGDDGKRCVAAGGFAAFGNALHELHAAG